MAAKPINKFTKSVLEREQKERSQPAPTKTIESIRAQPDQEQEVKPVPKTKPPASPKTKTSSKPANTGGGGDTAAELLPAAVKTGAELASQKVKQQPVEEETAAFSLERFLIPEQGRQAKNKTFYLDAAVIDAIKSAATANRIAESKLVNDILKKVLRV